MDADPGEIEERARTARLEPPVHGLEEPRWTAEDPVTGCRGIGVVEAEAVGNLVAAVARYAAEEPDAPYVKVPGRVMEQPRADDGGVLDRLL